MWHETRATRCQHIKSLCAVDGVSLTFPRVKSTLPENCASTSAGACDFRAQRPFPASSYICELGLIMIDWVRYC